MRAQRPCAIDPRTGADGNSRLPLRRFEAHAGVYRHLPKISNESKIKCGLNYFSWSWRSLLL